MIWKRLPVLITLPFLMAIVTEGQDQQTPNGPGPGSTEVKSKAFTITGAVRRPGSYPLLRRTTVFEAINDAGGFPDGLTRDDLNASKKDIKIIRGKQTLHFNYDDYVRGKNRDQNRDSELQDGDLVQVGLNPQVNGSEAPSSAVTVAQV